MLQLLFRTENDERPIHVAETAACLYLITPLFVFFAFFIRLELAIPACALIAFQVYEMVRRTSWRELAAARWEPVYFLALAVIWIALSGGIGPLKQNGDWWKHYSILNFLVEKPWPATAQAGSGESALRYTVGWYLVPALILKMTGADLQKMMLSVWSIIGVFLFFSLLPDLLRTRRAIIAAPLVFIVFSGMDFIGGIFNHYKTPGAEVHHYEWWAGWVQYSSNTTSLFWVPQHAIPAWLGVAILMRCRERTALLPYLALLVSSILLWSHFTAVGLVPFLVALLVHHGVRSTIVFNWRPLASVLLLPIPVGLYLLASAGEIPSGYIGEFPCIWGNEYCFAWPSYALFLAIEVGIPLGVLLLSREKEQGFLLAAAIALAVIPLYKIGMFNDFAMRASLPALAIVAILLGKVLVAGSPTRSTVIALFLLAALPTSIGEIYRGFMSVVPDVPPSTTFNHDWATPFLQQYFAPLPIWVLR